MDNRHKPGEVMTERRGMNRDTWDEMDDHERIEYLKRRQDRVDNVLFGFLDVLRIGIGHLWGWLNKGLRGRDG